MRGQRIAKHNSRGENTSVIWNVMASLSNHGLLPRLKAGVLRADRGPAGCRPSDFDPESERALMTAECAERAIIPTETTRQS
jgi:hypothetical protein